MTQLRRVFTLLLVLLSCSIHTSANADSLAQEIESLYQAKLKDLFLYFHQNPELSAMEHETSARLADELASLGFTVYNLVNVFLF